MLLSRIGQLKQNLNGKQKNKERKIGRTINQDLCPNQLRNPFSFDPGIQTTSDSKIKLEYDGRFSNFSVKRVTPPLQSALTENFEKKRLTFK